MTASLDLEPVLAPEFAATSIDGESVSLEGYRGRQHVVLVFNRGFA